MGRTGCWWSFYMLLLARASPMAEVKKKSEGMSVFLVDLSSEIDKAIADSPIRNRVNHQTNEIFIDKAASHAKDRGVFDTGQNCGTQAKISQFLAAEASREAANICLQIHRERGFAAEYDVERKLRETRLCQVVPISNKLSPSDLGERVLRIPRSHGVEKNTDGLGWCQH